jgi:hypothetical protein
MSSTTTHYHGLPLLCCLTLSLYDLTADCGRKSVSPRYRPARLTFASWNHRRMAEAC